MLSSNTVRTLTDCLIAADADAEQMGWGQPPTLLLVHDWLLTTRPKRRRKMRSLEFPLHPDDLLANPAGLPALLHRLAAGLTNPIETTPYQATLDTIISRIRATTPDARLVAWAACYDDIHTNGGQPRQARRVDAVDADGRVYQLTHLRGEDHPRVRVDDPPDPGDIPATYPGLVALLAATVHHVETRTAGGTPGPRRSRLRTEPEEPIFGVCGPDGASIRCRICGAVDEIASDEMPSMAGYGQDTYTKCTRCGSVETTDPIFGWRAQPAIWPPTPEPDQP
ncbi:hypothetical protein ACGFI9_31595 [Micromonospora sp. NPDC048930]|uniref:hypothetical protein n=1 Tax=Micromonospora sp. NPDC048930 TaxID=3364261 RepID=UPI0037173305